MGRSLLSKAVRTACAFGFLLTLFTAEPPARAASGSELQKIAAQMTEPYLDTASGAMLRGATLSYRDFQISFDSGTIVFFQPVRIDSTDTPYGALFLGRGRLQFQPALSMERQQLHRFLKSDSLNRPFGALFLYFDTVTHRKLLASSAGRVALPRQAQATIREMSKYFTEDKSRYFAHRSLLHLLQPDTERFVMALGKFPDNEILLATYDSFDREQIALYERQMQTVYRYVFQPVCSYALEADDRTGQYNGVEHTTMVVNHYDIDARIDHGGKITAATRLDFVIRRQPTHLLEFILDPEMNVDSIRDSHGDKVTFNRFKDEDRYYGLWLLLDSALHVGDSGSFSFYYSGDVAGMELGQYYVFAGASWYPRSSIERLEATFRIRLKSPMSYNLVATGRLVDSTVRRDTMITTWEIDQPSRNVSFNIGLFKEYRFFSEGEKPLKVFFSEDLHRWFGSVQGVNVRPSGKHMERQVAEDIQKSLKLYAEDFGPCPFDTIVVSEILQFASEAYPGFVHLSFVSWITTDDWGYNRLLRAHEAAHQWWGADVQVETYRDKWLSEGFAQYSALLYLQHVAGTDQFLDRLEESRSLILAGRKNAGALGLGTRTGNVKDKNSYLTITYHRGAYVLHMLRYLLMDWKTMNDDRFLALMREFHQTFQGRYASIHDFALLASKYAATDLKWFFDQWVYNNYIPTYDCRYSLTSKPDGTVTAHIRIMQRDVPETFHMFLPVEIEYFDGHKEYQRILVDKPVVEQQLSLSPRPKKIRFNPFDAVLAKVNQ